MPVQSMTDRRCGDKGYLSKVLCKNYQLGIAYCLKENKLGNNLTDVEHNLLASLGLDNICYS